MVGLSRPTFVANKHSGTGSLFMIRSLAAFSRERRTDRGDAERRRNLLAISVACFLAWVGMRVGMPSLPGLLREVSGSDSAGAGLWLGLAISVAPLMTAITGPF